MTLDLKRPHGFLLWKGKKRAVVRPAGDPLLIGEELEVVTGDEAFGVATLGPPMKMLASEVDRKEYFGDHRVRPDEREAWWPDETQFSVYPVERFEGYDEIVQVGGDWRGEKEGEMPYEIEERDGEFCVVKEGGEVEKCHPTEEEAQAHLTALRINVEAEEEKEAEPEPEEPQLSEEAKQRILDQVLEMAQAPEPEPEAAPVPEPDEGEKGQLKRLMERVEELEAELAAKAAPKKTVDGTGYPASAFLVVEDEAKPSTWHLRFKDEDGVSHRLMGAAWAALHEGYRGNKYEGPDKEGALKRLKTLYEKEGMDLPGEKERGEGMGAGGEPQGDGGAETCVCPECGAEFEHEKGTPCAEGKCPECGSSMAGKKDQDLSASTQKAGRRVKKTMRDRLQEAWEVLGEVLDWAKGPQAQEPTMADLFKAAPDAGFAVKQVNGEPWLLLWASNAFKDRDEEIFSTKGLEQFVLENEQKDERGWFNFWHVPGTDFAEKRWQGVIGRFLVEAGPFLDDAKGRAAKKFFEEHPSGHPDVAPEGWGASVEYRYLPEEKRRGTYNRFWITRTSVLPRTKAANVWTKGGLVMALTDDQKQGLEAIFPDEAQGVIDEAEAETKKLEEEGVEHKAADEKAMDMAGVAKAIRKLAGDAEGELAGKLLSLANEMGGDEEEEEKEVSEPEVPTIDMPALAREIAKQFDVQLQPVAEMKQAIERQQEQIAELEARLQKEQRAEKRRQEEELPRMILSWESKASEAEETVLEKDDPLLKMKPAEVKPTSGSGADHFFGRKR